jgi:hypothetical protein
MVFWGAGLSFVWVILGLAIIDDGNSLDNQILGGIIIFGGAVFTIQALLAGVWRVGNGIFVWDPLEGRRFRRGATIETRREPHSVLPLDLHYLYLIDDVGKEMRIDALARFSFLEDRRPLQAKREAKIRAWLES